jgi:hypothetical protein
MVSEILYALCASVVIGREEGPNELVGRGARAADR